MRDSQPAGVRAGVRGCGAQECGVKRLAVEDRRLAQGGRLW
jgi:hypothetical protein